jgi:hypothetical protein
MTRGEDTSSTEDVPAKLSNATRYPG